MPAVGWCRQLQALRAGRRGRQEGEGEEEAAQRIRKEGQELRSHLLALLHACIQARLAVEAEAWAPRAGAAEAPGLALALSAGAAGTGPSGQDGALRPVDGPGRGHRERHELLLPLAHASTAARWGEEERLKGFKLLALACNRAGSAPNAMPPVLQHDGSISCTSPVILVSR